jgi:hypothetical protein
MKETMMKKIDSSNSNTPENSGSGDIPGAGSASPADGSGQGGSVDYKREREGLSHPLFRLFDRSGTKHVVISEEVPLKAPATAIRYHVVLKHRWSDGSEITDDDVRFIKERLDERATKFGYGCFVDVHR